MANGLTFGYDAENTLNSTDGPSSIDDYDFGTYADRMLGFKRWTIFNQYTNFYHYDGDQLIAEYDGSWPFPGDGRVGLLRKFVRGPGVDEAFYMYDEQTDAGTFALHDRLGSTVLTTDENGAAVDKIAYSPYGEPSVTTGFPFKFTGQRYDAQVGLHYYKARWYDSGSGRFLQTDPIGFEDQMNLYAYCGNDPVGCKDPSGEILWQLGFFVVGAGASLAGAVIENTGVEIDTSSVGGFLSSATEAISEVGLDDLQSLTAEDFTNAAFDGAVAVVGGTGGKALGIIESIKAVGASTAPLKWNSSIPEC